MFSLAGISARATGGLPALLSFHHARSTRCGESLHSLLGMLSGEGRRLVPVVPPRLPFSLEIPKNWIFCGDCLKTTGISE